MATAEKTGKKSSSKKSVTKDQIISKYMNFVLESERLPKSIFKFCKEIKISEAEFYIHFGSFESLQKGVWAAFFEQTMKVISKSTEYEDFGKREKLLTFYFTLFEILTLNRSYILFNLKNPLDLGQLSDMRIHFLDYIHTLSEFGGEGEQLKQYSAKAIEELGWAQFLVILRFWIKDDSAQFEKTDVMIEKTINTTFDVVDTTPIKSVIDYAKFLFKETVGK